MVGYLIHFRFCSYEVYSYAQQNGKLQQQQKINRSGIAKGYFSLDRE